MGHGSKINGDVEVEKAIINGEINGNIKCHDYLELNTNAIVNGSVEYDIIVVHEGSEINGNLRFIKNKKNNIIFHMLSTVFVFALFFDKGLLKNTFLLSIVQIHSKNHSWREST